MLASPAAHLAALGRLSKAALLAGCKDDPRCGAEFRCIAAKVQDYISFGDNDAASEAEVAAVYLKRRSEKKQATRSGELATFSTFSASTHGRPADVV
ncbi:MAG TPA: hypothetical protein VGJ10_07065 [Paraburkholderia sp.]|jgi:hypothetical protein